MNGVRLSASCSATRVRTLAAAEIDIEQAAIDLLLLEQRRCIGDIARRTDHFVAQRDQRVLDEHRHKGFVLDDKDARLFVGICSGNVISSARKR